MVFRLLLFKLISSLISDRIKEQTFVYDWMENMKKDINKAIDALSKRDISDMKLVYKEDFLNKLNHEQRVAATRKEGDYLVIAGPGSGKTHTLAYRVVYLVKNNVDPQSIVVITFTRKAGRELKERINHLLPNTALGFVGTFHAFSHYISTKLGNSSPISGFRLLDPEDDVQVHKLVMADFREFNKKIRPKRLQKIISYCNNTQLSVKDYVKEFDLKELDSDVENLEDYRNEYEKYKAGHLLANYDDMIQNVTKYLKANGSKKVTANFEYLMVDEYQDTNQMQLDFIKKLNIQNTMAIGDDFQGIYAFRGADHRIILNFINDFNDAKMIKLKDNYRSTGEIVDYVNKTVERSNLGYHKQFRVVKQEKGGAEVVSGRSLEEHKTFILEKIKKYPNKTHALIYRYNKNRTVFEKAFIEENIEYSVYGGIRLLERKHVKDVLAFLMVYLNRLDIVSFNRLLTLLPGIGPKTARKIIDTRLDDVSFVSSNNRQALLDMKGILDSRINKEDLFKNVCDFYFSIYEHVESEAYTKDDIKDDFKLIKELLVTYDSLNNFIINLILDPVVDMHKGDKPKVILTTIHSAKGLEFDKVYYFHTHDWYKNFDVESLEEDRRLFYVGISRAKENLYVFDHTGYSRSFDDILKDFDNMSVVNPDVERTYASEAVELVKEPQVKEKVEPVDHKTDYTEIDLDSVFELIDGEPFDQVQPTIDHQNTLSALSSELYIYLRKKPYKSIVGPMKIKLIKKDKSEHFVQPDLFVIKEGCDVPELIVEVISSETRSKDMIKKMELYMSSGVKEYWLIDGDANMTMVHAFDAFDLKATRIFMSGQQIQSVLFEDLSIEVDDLI